MSIKSYAFRQTITALAFLIGFSAYRGLQKLERFSLSGSLSSGAATVKRLVPFQNEEKLDGSNVEGGNTASYNFTGTYYLSEENFPSEFIDFGHLELGTPAGTLYTDQAYTIRTMASDRDSLVFETEVNRGISYRFVGRVRRSGDRDRSSHESRVGDIIGKLEKLKNGEAIATLETTFYLFGH